MERERGLSISMDGDHYAGDHSMGMIEVSSASELE